jgi:23S rRNA (pseudouridine1915-N3)-methyltransferase
MWLIAVGKLRPGPEREVFERYNARLRPGFTVREVAEATGSAEEAKRREGNALLAALPEGATAVALDLGGPAWDSAELARRLERWMGQQRPLGFLIGGAEGLSGEVIARADASLSLGPMTWPHLLVRVLLAEQLYRAQSILTGHPYHRAGRP